MPDLNLADLERSLAAADALSATPPPAAPPAPRLPALDLDALEQSLAAADNAPAAAAFQANRALTQSVAAAANSLLAVGEPTPAQGPAFVPDDSGPRDYLYRFSGGRLALPSRARTDAAEARDLVNFKDDYLRRNPYQADALANNPPLQRGFNKLARTVVAVNTDPPTPEERMAAFDLTLAERFKDKPLPPDDAARAKDVYAKVWHLDPSTIDQPSNALSSDELQTFQALGGHDFLSFARSREQANTSQVRGTRLLGQPIDGPLRFDHLAAVSPLADALVKQGNAAAAFDAQFQTERREAFRGRDADFWLDIYDGGLRGAAQRVVAGAGGGVDAALLGIPGDLTRTVEDISQLTVPGTRYLTKDGLSAAELFDTASSFWGRVAAASGGHAPHDAVERVNYLLSDTPGLSDADAAEVTRRHLNITQAIQQRGEEFGLSPDVAGFLADGLGLTLAEPESFLLTALGLYGWSGHLKARRNPVTLGEIRAPLSAEAVESLKRGPAFQDVALHGQMLEETARHLRSITDPAEARGIVARLEATMKRTDQPLTAEIAAAATTHIDRVKLALDKAKGAETLTPDAQAALAGLSEPISALNYYDAAAAITGSPARAQSLALSAEARNWLEAQSKTTTHLEIPANVSDGYALQRGLIDKLERTQLVTQRKTRILDITGQLDTQLSKELDLLQSQKTTAAKLHNQLASDWNDSVRGAANRVADLDTNGGRVLTPKAALATPGFQKLRAAVENTPAGTVPRGKIREFWASVPDPGDAAARDARILAAANDPDVYRALATPDFRAALKSVADDPAAAERLTIARARELYRETLKPDARPVAPRPDPRLGFVDELNSRLDAVPPGELIQLTKSELAALNEYRSAPLVQPKAHTVRRLPKSIEALDAQIAKTTKLRAQLADLRKQTQDAPLDKLSLDVPAPLRAELYRKLDLMPDKRHLPLSPEPTAAELTAREAFQEAVEFHTKEYGPLLEGVTRATAYEMQFIPKSQQRHILRESINSAAAYADYIRYENRRLSRMLHRELKPGEAQSLLRDMKDGVARSEPSAILIQKLRREQLDKLLRLGSISPEFYDSLLKQNYYHGVFDRHTRAALDRLSAGRVTAGRFQPLKVDPAEFKFKIPEEPNGYYAVWKEGEAIHHKTGFKSADEANKFLETLPDTVTQAEALRNLTFNDKLLRGLIGDAGTSALTLNEAMGRHIAAEQLGAVAASSGYVKTARELGIDPAAQGVQTVLGAPDAPPTRWHKIPDNYPIPRLHGKWVNSDMIGFMDEHLEGFNHIDAITKGLMEAATSPEANTLLGTDSRLIQGGGKVAGIAGRVAFNALSAAKVALSHVAWTAARLGNLFYTWAGGVPFSPKGIYHRAAAEFGPNGYWGRVARNADDPIMTELRKRGYVPPLGRGTTPNLVNKATAKFWESTDALRARIEHLEGEILKEAPGSDLPGLQTERARLEAELSKKLNAGTTDFVRSVFGWARDNALDAAKGLAGKESKNINRLWNVYDAAGGDTASKYAIASWMMKEHGYTVTQAVDHAAAFTQQLHRVPSAIKKVTGRLGGAQFVSFPLEQIRIWSNVLRHNPAAVGRAMALTAGWNRAVIAAQGDDYDAYMERYAFAQGLDRGTATDAQALLSGLLIPMGGGQLYRMSYAPFLGNITSPESRFAKAATKAITGDSRSPWLSLGVNNVVGAISKFAGSDVIFQTMLSIGTGTDEKGDPIKDAGDVLGLLQRTFTPDWFPGNRDARRLGRVLSGQEVDPQTHRTSGLAALALERFAKIRRDPDDWRHLAAAIQFVQASSGNQSAYKAQEHFDDLRSTLVARGAVNPDGSIDETKQRAILEDFYRDRGHLPAAGGTKIPKQPSSQDFKEAMEESARPTTLNRFYRLSVDAQLDAYIHYRANNPTPQPELHDRVVKLLDRKLTGRGLDKVSLQRASDLIDTFLNRPESLPADAIVRLKRWQGLARLGLTGGLSLE